MRADPQDLQASIGRQESASQRVDAATAARMAALLGRARAPAAGEALPLPWHWCWFTPLARPGELGADGHPRTGAFLPRIEGARRMWAGSRLRVHGAVGVDELLDRRSTISDARTRQGRGGELVFITLAHKLSVNGRLVIEEQQDIVYRDAAGSAAPAPPEQTAMAAQFSRVITPDPVLLFRYSALTFNAHRIHYDREYAMRVEGYPGLVVQAPLTATLLLDLLAAERPQLNVQQLSFRAQRPLFDTAPFTLNGRVDANRATLWAAGPDGGVALTMEIELGDA